VSRDYCGGACARLPIPVDSGDQDQYGETERTWTFSEPQSAYRLERKIKSENEASTAAAS
jgi:hypothetical protein